LQPKVDDMASSKLKSLFILYKIHNTRARSRKISEIYIFDTIYSNKNIKFQNYSLIKIRIC